MKKTKNDAVPFQAMDPNQMSKINGGGYWYIVKDEKGKIVIKMWIE